MANTDSKEAASPTFEPYQWAHRGAKDITMQADALLGFADRVQAIAGGSQIILEIAEASDGEAESEATPYFSKYYTSTLLRMVQINMEMLGRESERINDWAFRRTNEGRIADYRQAAFSLQTNGQQLPSLD